MPLLSLQAHRFRGSTLCDVIVLCDVIAICDVIWRFVLAAFLVDDWLLGASGGWSDRDVCLLRSLDRGNKNPIKLVFFVLVIPL